MDAEHFPLSRGSRQRTGRAVGTPKEKRLGSRRSLRGKQTVTLGPVLTFLRAAVLLAGGQLPEAVGVAQAAAVVEELALHAGHVEEVLPEQGTARTHLAGESADLGDFWRGR